jgi:hypothetical protein
VDLQEIGKEKSPEKVNEKVKNLTEVIGVSKEKTVEEKVKDEKRQRLNG